MTKITVGTRELTIAVTGLSMLFGEAFMTQTKKVAEHYKGS